MKKLLSILSSISVASVAATSVVACSVPSTTVDVNIQGSNISSDGKTYTFNGVKYSKSQLDTAMNGNFAVINNLSSAYHVGMSFDELNMELLNLFTFNQSLFVKTQNDNAQLRSFRNQNLGRDAQEVTKESYKDVPTVDGIKFNKIDTDAYYSKFTDTTINSLVGLQDLYKASNNGNPREGWGKGAKASLKVAKTIFGSENPNKDAVKTLMENFANSDKNPAFTNITYKADLQEYKSTSQLLPTFSDVAGYASDSITPESSAEYAKNNTKIKVKDDDATSRIQDKSESDPYGVLLLKAADDVDIKSTSLSNVPTKGKQVLKEIFSKDSGATVYYSQSKGDEDKYSLSQNIGQYVLKKAEPLKVSYHFETNMKRNASSYKDKAKGSEGFNIDFTVDNLVEVFSPYISSVQSNTISSIKTKDGKRKAFFSGHIDDKELQNVKVDIDGSNAEINNDKDKTAWVEVPDKAEKITVKDKGATFEYDVPEKNDTDFQTNQLSWVFRGYKFIDADSQISKFGDDMTKEEAVAANKDGAPERNLDLEAEITHNLRDIKITFDQDGIKAAEKPEAEYLNK